MPPHSTRRARPAVHLALLAATLYTLTLCGAIWRTGLPSQDAGVALRDPAFLARGLSYSLCLLAILGVHELGHYLACRRYRVDASLPYFLPSLPVPIGTFGAFIRIREPIPHRRALFDIGVAGPIAGFLVALPVLAYGVATAEPVPMSASAGSVDEPLLLAWLFAWLGPPAPEGHMVLLSGPLMAGWVGCLATALNLLPVGQLDGGHVCYALSPRVHRAASIVTLAGFTALGLLAYPPWLFLAALLVLFGPRHPPVLDETAPLSPGRRLTALLALAILLVCFIPRPFADLAP